MLSKEEIKKKITELTKQRDEFVLQANAVVREMNGKIAAFTEAIAEPQLSLVPDPEEEKAGDGA